MICPIPSKIRLPVLAALLALACDSAHALTCQNGLQPNNPDSVYAIHADATITDLRSSLMWKKCVEGMYGDDCASGTADSLSWTAAQAVAQASTFAGYSDWRVPNIRELQSLVEDCRSHPDINTTVFPNTPLWVFWSGSPDVGDARYAWVVWIENGEVRIVGRSVGYNVRLVRAGQAYGDLLFRNGFERAN